MEPETPRQTNVRFTPSEMAHLRKALALPPNTSGPDALRAAVSRLTGIPAAQMVRPSGRPKKRATV